MTYYKKQLPKYCRHKTSGRAFVRIGGKMYYLGKHGSAASRREYDRIIAEFVANGRQPFYRVDELTIESLIWRFLDYANRELCYCDTTKKRITITLRALNALYGKQLVSQFTPSALKILRQQFVDRKLARHTVNGYVGIIKQVFYWGCEEEIVPAEIGAALRMVKHLQAGRTSAVDYDDIEPVEEEIVNKTLPYLKPMVQDMVRVQRCISGRPQDVFNMRACDIDRSGAIWKYTPFTHKTKKRGKIRELPIGPKAQQILQPHIDRCKDDPEQFIFKTPRGSQCYGGYYNQAIITACKKAGIAKWTPNQLRHAGGTEIRSKFGLDHAQAGLGHAKARTTEIYAKIAYEKAAQVAAEIG
jgi:integrase